MAELWEWTGVDGAGKPREYQTIMPSISSESEMLAHLKASYHGLTITSLRRCHDREAKQSTGRVERHAFQYGIWDEVMRELGMNPDTKQSIAERFRNERLRLLAGATTRNTYVPIRERVRPIVRG